jgi:hypothetical protein
MDLILGLVYTELILALIAILLIGLVEGLRWYEYSRYRTGNGFPRWCPEVKIKRRKREGVIVLDVMFFVDILLWIVTVILLIVIRVVADQPNQGVRCYFLICLGALIILKQFFFFLV